MLGLSRSQQHLIHQLLDRKGQQHTKNTKEPYTRNASSLCKGKRNSEFAVSISLTSKQLTTLYWLGRMNWPALSGEGPCSSAPMAGAC